MTLKQATPKPSGRLLHQQAISSDESLEQGRDGLVSHESSTFHPKKPVLAVTGTVFPSLLSAKWPEYVQAIMAWHATQHSSRLSLFKKAPLMNRSAAAVFVVHKIAIIPSQLKISRSFGPRGGGGGGTEAMARREEGIHEQKCSLLSALASLSQRQH